MRGEKLRELDRRVIAALVRAQAHAGLESRAAFAKLLDQATGGEGPDVSTFNKWSNGSVRPPAWILPLVAEVASEVSGKPISVSALLKEPRKTGSNDQPTPEVMARLKRVEDQVDRLLPLAFRLQQLLRQSQGQDNPGYEAAGS